MQMIPLRAVQKIDALPAVFFRLNKSGILLNRICRYLVKFFFELVKHAGRYRAGILVLPIADQDKRIPSAEPVQIKKSVRVINKAVIKKKAFVPIADRGSLHGVHIEIIIFTLYNLN